MAEINEEFEGQIVDLQPLPKLKDAKRMSMIALVEILRFCPYSQFFLKPARVFQKSLKTKEQAIFAVESMIAKHTAPLQDSLGLQPIHERSMRSEESLVDKQDELNDE